MGNRATVIFTDDKSQHSPAVYLHWNGGPESVYGFLEELDRRDVRADQEYECARFIQLVGEFFNQDNEEGLSLGVANATPTTPGALTLRCLENVPTDHGDNGFYLVNRTSTPMHVRRIVQTYDAKSNSASLKEMSELEVKREKKQADKHEYRAAFRTVFAEISKQRLAKKKQETQA